MFWGIALAVLITAIYVCLVMGSCELVSQIYGALAALGDLTPEWM